jgi:hypothetical protein
MLKRELPNAALLNISFQSGLRNLHNRTIALSRVRAAKTIESGGTKQEISGAIDRENREQSAVGSGQ